MHQTRDFEETKRDVLEITPKLSTHHDYNLNTQLFCGKVGKIVKWNQEQL